VYKKKKKAERNKRRQDKIMRRLRRKNKRKRIKTKGKQDINIKRRAEHKVVSPGHLSLVDNSEETAFFFKMVFEAISKCKKGQSIFFDLSSVTTVTVDAIMYLIAVINNSRVIKQLDIICRGNVPTNMQASAMFEDVGFYNYVRRINSSKKRNKKDDRIKIVNGKEADGEITSSICDFVNEKIKSADNLATKRLYPMMVELMTNVKQHAYHDRNNNMSARWYAYAEDCKKNIKFVFLDTGVGIPATIRKNWSERIREGIKGIIGGDSDDPTYIEAALNGEFRTETKQEHRGKGLPEIKNAIISADNRLNDLKIVSGHGICTINRFGWIERQFLETAFEGTLFMWYFDKEAI